MTKLPLKAQAPDFSLTGVSGETITLSDFRGGFVTLAFLRGFA